MKREEISFSSFSQQDHGSKFLDLDLSNFFSLSECCTLLHHHPRKEKKWGSPCVPHLLNSIFLSFFFSFTFSHSSCRSFPPNLGIVVFRVQKSLRRLSITIFKESLSEILV
ncbi:hypothetical protein RCL1_007285 [Eukaryota sp. TZLM3-RCL]